MTIARSTLVAAVLLVSSTAWAANGPDLSVIVTPPVSSTVNQMARYTVRVTNSGNKPATGVLLTIQLPPTHTSPQVYVMGVLGARTATCTLSGTSLACPIGRVGRSSTASVFFDIALPYSTEVLVISAAVQSSPVDLNPFNNSTSRIATPSPYNTAMVTGVTATNWHCTGNPSLSSYFECTLFPSSITSHETVFNSNGTMGFIGVPPTYSGTWFYSASLRQLHFRYFESGQIVAEFDGRGTSVKCFEGKTTFASNPDYVSMYQVCFP